MNGAGFGARVVREDLEQSAHGPRRAAGADAVVNMYVWRTNSEKLIKELKDSLGLDTFCLQTIDETDVTFLGRQRPRQPSSGLSRDGAPLVLA